MKEFPSVDTIKIFKLLNCILPGDSTAQKVKFSIKDSVNLVTFSEKILNGKLHFLCSAKTLLLASKS